MKSYQIHFIRHGATAANREGRYVGVTDTPLSQEGIGKLEDMNRRYSYPGAPVFYVSPLKRCVETCKIIYPQVTPIGRAEGRPQISTVAGKRSKDRASRWGKRGRLYHPGSKRFR